MNDELVITPVGTVSTEVLDYLCSGLPKYFGRPCYVATPAFEPKFTFDAQRRQYPAEAILQQLQPRQHQHMLGVIDSDLYVPHLNFVFGLADWSKRRAVIGLPRLRESFYGRRDNSALFLERVLKEAIHELGHVYGLKHCNDPHCIMFFSNTLADTDRKGVGFCANCQSRIPGIEAKNR